MIVVCLDLVFVCCISTMRVVQHLCVLTDPVPGLHSVQMPSAQYGWDHVKVSVCWTAQVLNHADD